MEEVGAGTQEIRQATSKRWCVLTTKDGDLEEDDVKDLKVSRRIANLGGICFEIGVVEIEVALKQQHVLPKHELKS